jgi:hypothetical protein
MIFNGGRINSFRSANKLRLREPASIFRRDPGYSDLGVRYLA